MTVTSHVRTPISPIRLLPYPINKELPWLGTYNLLMTIPVSNCILMTTVDASLDTESSGESGRDYHTSHRLTTGRYGLDWHLKSQTPLVIIFGTNSIAELRRHSTVGCVTILFATPWTHFNAIIFSLLETNSKFCRTPSRNCLPCRKTVCIQARNRPINLLISFLCNGQIRKKVIQLFGNFNCFSNLCFCYPPMFITI